MDSAETQSVTCRPKGKRLTQADLGALLQLHRAGKTQTEIAQALGCTQQSVSRWLDTMADSTEIAKVYLRGSAIRMAKNIVRTGRAADHVKTLEGINVLSPTVTAGLTIQIGIKDSDVSVNLSPSSSQLPGESTQNP